MRCSECGSQNWSTDWEPYERIKCGDCGYYPPATMPGAQRDFVLSEARYPGYFAGRGSGKTVAGVLKLWRYAYAYPGALLFATQPVSDGFEQNLLPAAREIFGAGEGREWHYKEKKGQIVFPGLGTTVLLLSAEGTIPGTGASFAAGWIDEVGIGNQRDFFLQLQPAMRQKGYPHQIWVTSTPNVDFPWIRQIWVDHVHPLTERELKDVTGRYPIYRAHTKDNPHLDPEIREELLAEWEGTRYAAQYLGGEFIAVEGAAFELSEQIQHRDPNEPRWIREHTGFDLGGTSPTAILRWRMDESHQLWATDEFYKRDADEYEWGPWLQERGIMQVACDPSISDKQLMEWRQRWGIHFKRARVKKFNERIQLWRSWLTLRPATLGGQRSRAFITRDCPNTWKELINLTYAKPRGHEYANDAWGAGVQDHAYDAGAYGLAEFEAVMGRPRPSWTPGDLVTA